MELFIAITLFSSSNSELIFFERVGARKRGKGARGREGSVSNMANSRPKVIACLSGLALPFVAVALPTERTTFGHGVKTNELPRPLRPSLP